MNIKDIKNHANKIYIQYRKQIIPEFFYVGYVGVLAQYLRSGIFSFLYHCFYALLVMGM